MSEVLFVWCILKDERFDTGAFLLYLLVSQASLPKFLIAYGGFIIFIAYAWGFEAQVRQLTLLFMGRRLNMATCLQMDMFKMEGGRVGTNCHGRSLFSLPNLGLTSYANPTNWTYDDDIDMVSNEEGPQAQGGNVGGGVGSVGVEDTLDSSGDGELFGLQ